jgi:hypothetical protein
MTVKNRDAKLKVCARPRNRGNNGINISLREAKTVAQGISRLVWVMKRVAPQVYPLPLNRTMNHEVPDEIGILPIVLNTEQNGLTIQCAPSIGIHNAEFWPRGEAIRVTDAVSSHKVMSERSR